MRVLKHEPDAQFVNVFRGKFLEMVKLINAREKNAKFILKLLTAGKQNGGDEYLRKKIFLTRILPTFYTRGDKLLFTTIL